jgi:hypothetical protein
MSYRKIFKAGIEDFMKKYKVSERMDNIVTNDNVRLSGWVFILSRVYRIYELVNI